MAPDPATALRDALGFVRLVLAARIAAKRAQREDPLIAIGLELRAALDARPVDTARAARALARLDGEVHGLDLARDIVVTARERVLRHQHRVGGRRSDRTPGRL